MGKTGFKTNLEALKREFYLRRIDTDRAGFYDEPNFLSAERANPSFLENYAAYVELRGYSEEYLVKAKEEIPFIVKLLLNELLSDGRLGACVDISQVLGRILEREGFWNYQVKGSLTIKFPPEATLKNRYFWSVDTIQYAAAHAWVISPPFNIIDITIRQQPYSHGEEKWLPNFVIHSDYKSCKIQDEDLISPESRMLMKLQGYKEPLVKYTKENFASFVKIFKANLVEIAGVRFKYIPVGISVSEHPLEHITSLNLSGRVGLEIYNDLIKPKLAEFRKL